MQILFFVKVLIFGYQGDIISEVYLGKRVRIPREPVVVICDLSYFSYPIPLIGENVIGAATL